MKCKLTLSGVVLLSIILCYSIVLAGYACRVGYIKVIESRVEDVLSATGQACPKLHGVFPLDEQFDPVEVIWLAICQHETTTGTAVYRVYLNQQDKAKDRAERRW